MKFHIEKMHELAKHPRLLASKVMIRCPELFASMSDEMYLALMYKSIFGKKLDLLNPKTYSEKLQWMKLYDRNSLYTTLVDKYAAKEYLSNVIGEEHIVPTLGVWNSFNEIPIAKLPQRFVLKCTHDSGGVVICKDKAHFDVKRARRTIEKSLNRDYYLLFREWPYKNVPRRIIAEPYLGNGDGEGLIDYKFFLFDGVPKMLFVATGRQSGDTRFDFFDMDYRPLPFLNGHKKAENLPNKPKSFDEMLDLACKIGSTVRNARIDFYDIGGRAVFGEVTFFHWSGLVPYEPEEWDAIIGSWMTLPKGHVR